MSEVRLAAGEHIPRATYRLQLHKDFTFADATALVPYLARLGISHVYCSPYLRARSGSLHGYDIIDHLSLNPEIGSDADFDAFTAALHSHGMGQLMDVVPNHMGVMGADNAWWQSLLEHGRASEHARSFDIDWDAPSADLHNRLLLPVLGEHYGKVLASGELELRFEAESGSFAVHYFQHRFPVDPREYPRVLGRAETTSRELAQLAAQFAQLAPRDAPNAETSQRGERSSALKAELSRLCAHVPEAALAVQQAVAAHAGSAGHPGGFDALHELLEAQAYRLAYWRVASDEINYRRFFDINDLAALRMEHEPTFAATHSLVFELVRSGVVSGLRVDHPDGLYDPAGYFERLQSQSKSGREDGAPLYVVIEKIVAPFESIPEIWPVYGTTGYRFANLVNGVLVDTSQRNRFTRVYHHFVGDTASFEEIAVRSKRLVLRTTMASELTMLATRLLRIAKADRSTRDYTLNTLRQALAEVIAAFPVYRTYIAESVSPEDRRYIEWAVSSARRHSQAADLTIFDFVRAALLRELGEDDSTLRAEVRIFAGKFQQITSPVTAKGVEDTAFYVYNRLLSLNEVGGDPGSFGLTVKAFHGASADRAAKWPCTMLATSTHDSKRSEDVRCRINPLSESPAAWRLLLRRWSRMNRSRKVEVEGAPAPSRNDEYLIYQTLIGTFPLQAGALNGYRERIEAYLVKAMREAKVHTSWINPNQQYEEAVLQFVRALLGEADHNMYLEDLRSTVVPIAWYGMLNSLSMMLLKLCSPGVPDIYQGNETWDFSLVDPDNRRPVDYGLRREALESVISLASDPNPAARLRGLFASLSDARTKLYFVWRLIALRMAHRDLFLNGGYIALKAHGRHADHVVAFARRHGDRTMVVIAGRLFARLGLKAGELPCGAVWSDTRVRLPMLKESTRLTDWLTGQTREVRDGSVRMSSAWSDLPGAVLLSGSTFTDVR